MWQSSRLLVCWGGCSILESFYTKYFYPSSVQSNLSKSSAVRRQMSSRQNCSIFPCHFYNRKINNFNTQTFNWSSGGFKHICLISSFYKISIELKIRREKTFKKKYISFLANISPVDTFNPIIRWDLPTEPFYQK